MDWCLFEAWQQFRKHAHSQIHAIDRATKVAWIIIKREIPRIPNEKWPVSMNLSSKKRISSDTCWNQILTAVLADVTTSMSHFMPFTPVQWKLASFAGWAGTEILTRIPKLTFTEFPLFADLADSFRSPSTVEYLRRPEARTTNLWCRRPACSQAFRAV